MTEPRACERSGCMWDERGRADGSGPCIDPTRLLPHCLVKQIDDALKAQRETSSAIEGS